MTNHEQEHCGCGCGGDHDHSHHNHVEGGPVSENQAAFLHQLGHSRYLPVARFLLGDSGGEFSAVTLAPVFLRAAADDMAAVKEAGAFLQKLEDMGLLTLDYDIPLEGYGYEEYTGSALYARFCDTVREAAGKEGFLGNTPRLELGSMALTDAGGKIAGEVHGHSH